MNTNTTNSSESTGTWQKIIEYTGFANAEDRYLELIENPPEDRPSRLCVSISDIHLTDGTVGFQNLDKYTWDAFYTTILQRCIKYKIKELLFVLDGDIIDIIRSSRWAENGVYPWERQRKKEFSAVVNQIIVEIVEKQHQDFFAWLQELPGKLEKDTKKILKSESVKVVITLGNHDKELFCDEKALAYFYEQGLGIKLKDIPKQERAAIGRMYGDEKMFASVKKAPYLPFYYGDRGFRFFTTHGQWRDQENSRAVEKSDDLPGWSAKDGWNTEIWQKLRYSPFLLPCFGDTVAAGVLSSFIYKVKKQLKEAGINDPELDSIIDELDLYRPTYAALTRILQETGGKREKRAIKIIEDTIYVCIIDWLSWDFTYESSPLLRRFGLKLAKGLLEFLNSLGHGLKIKAIAGLLKVLEFFSNHHEKKLSLKEMKSFPGFMQAYRHYGFQIHGEGHTHHPLQEELNIKGDHPSTYINFGTWRDQLIPRKNQGYRRRGVLRALFILDLYHENNKLTKRSFDYFVQDVIRWGDDKDALDKESLAESDTPETML